MKKSILVNSYRKSIKGTIYKFLMGSLPAFVCLLLLGKTFLETSILNSVLIGLGILSIIALIRFFYFIFQETIAFLKFKYTESVYGDALILLKDSFAKAHHYRKTPGHQDPEFMDSLINFCDNLKKVFDNITKGNCSVSVKVPIQMENVDEKASMQNLARDPKNRLKRDTTEYQNTNHTIIGNTAFHKTLNNVLKNNSLKYYLNNCISETADYENTSKDSNADGIIHYESELVYPIIPIVNDDETTVDCKGFLCVDCDRKNAFDDKYSVAIIEGVADGLYDLFNERSKQI